MITNILQYLEEDAKRHPDKKALADENEALNYKEYEDAAKRIGSFIAQQTQATQSPVAVLIDRNVRSIVSFMGVVYSGNFYVPIDMTMPEARVGLIIDTLKPILVIDARTKVRAEYEGAYRYEDIVLFSGNKESAERETEPSAGADTGSDLLGRIRRDMIDTDPLYAIFTSGSTGVPKGVAISHRSVIDLLGAFEEAFAFGEDSIFANQAPFDFDVSVKDIYNALYVGGTVEVLPKKLFKMPKLLVGYLKERNADTLIWAVSALRIISDFAVLEDTDGLKIKNVMFSGEVMPPKSLNYWMDHLPDVRYVNLYGPTEITCNCTYHIIDRRYRDDEMIPAGKAFRNTRVMLINEKGSVVKDQNEVGEICVAGTGLALGYWNNPEKTHEAFATDPTISAYDSYIYRTGDMGFYNENRDIVFASRRDHQIKHMGHRIELGEIEVALNAIAFITIACCIYDEKRERIVCHYQASDECKKEIVSELSKKLPKYMWPNDYVRHDEMPLNQHGKIDRIALKDVV